MSPGVDVCVTQLPPLLSPFFSSLLPMCLFLASFPGPCFQPASCFFFRFSANLTFVFCQVFSQPHSHIVNVFSQCYSHGPIHVFPFSGPFLCQPYNIDPPPLPALSWFSSSQTPRSHFHPARSPGPIFSQPDSPDVPALHLFPCCVYFQ